MRKVHGVLGNYKWRIAGGLVVVICIFSFLYVRAAVGDLVTRNGADVSILGPAMLSESGPNFKLAAEDLLEMVDTYAGHMGQRRYSGLMRAFYGKYCPVEVLERVKETLEEAKGKSQEACARDIWLAGEMLEQYRMMTTSFGSHGSDSKRYEKVDDELIEDIKEAIEDSRESLDRFLKNRTLINAVFLCEDDRRALLLIFLARAGYGSGHKELFDDFQKIVNEASQAEKEKAGELPVDSYQEKTFFEHIIASEERRSKVLEAVKQGAMDKARTLMWETIETAYHERPVILEFTAAVEFGETDEWKRPGS